ncbi:hypothetical protein K474DRAFT_1674898 [Panus rudis PR-1116 ss-1]|nr:hypothetical protein K474DRAFT_1674898 [Panus rudis PR-1116 ss-1]
MFSKFFISAALVLGLTLQVSAHAIITPALGVTGQAARSDVTRPSKANPCGGGVNVASVVGQSTPVSLNADGTFAVNVTNFNGGKDGSRQVTVKVDTTGTGKSFNTAATVTQNGDAAPSNVGSQEVTVQMPAGTTCDGTGCLAAFTTAGGFGNCVLVQSGAAGAAGNSTTGANNAATGAAAAAATTGNGRGRGRKAKNAQRADIDIRAVGTRAARAYRRAQLVELDPSQIPDDSFSDLDELSE